MNSSIPLLRAVLVSEVEGVESSSHFAALGLDVFYNLLYPAGKYDSLPVRRYLHPFLKPLHEPAENSLTHLKQDDFMFGHLIIIISVLLLSVASASYHGARRSLRTKWLQ
mmetsp:Transcript_260/g.789  ORF Transcript_260/g.789 Transcript_260/m.789 type:complete len:110 (-) Transcript_260:334-663(-)